MQLLSVIVPVYNGEKTILRLLKCLWRQSYPRLEIIIVNDGSTDRSHQLIQRQLSLLEGKRKGSRSFLYIRQENAGAAAARNAGILAASGDYITFADQDDYILPDYCRDFMRAAQASSPDFLVGGYQRVAEDGKILRTQRIGRGEFAPFLVMAPWAHIYKKSFLIDNKIFFLKTDLGEDVYFNFLAISLAKKIEMVDNTDYKWIFNEQSVSNTRQKKVNDLVNPLLLLNSIAKRMEESPPENQELCEYFLARYVSWYILFSYRQSDRKKLKQARRQLHGWLEKNFPDYEKNPYLHFRRPQGESMTIAVCVWLYFNFLIYMPFVF